MEEEELLAMDLEPVILIQTLKQIVELGHNPAQAAPDLVGVPDRWAKVAERMSDLALEAIKAWEYGDR